MLGKRTIQMVNYCLISLALTRKIHDVHVRHPTIVTTEALSRIGALYAIESEIRGSPAEV